MFQHQSPFVQVVLLKTLSELHAYVDRSNLTEDYGGTVKYCHNSWFYFYKVSNPHGILHLLKKSVCFSTVLSCHQILHIISQRRKAWMSSNKRWIKPPDYFRGGKGMSAISQWQHSKSINKWPGRVRISCRTASHMVPAMKSHVLESANAQIQY